MVVSVVQWLMLGVATIAHPFFISMTEINHNATNKTLEVSVRIYADDFEKALSKNCNCKIQLLKPTDKPAMDKAVSTYIANHLQIKVDGQPAALQYAGYQEEEGSIWTYFEVKNVASVKKVEITNSLLYEYKEEQINMVHVKANGKERSDKLDYPERSLVFVF